MPALLLALAEAIIGFFIRYIGPLLLQALVFFGLTFVTQKYVTTNFVQYIQGAIGGAPATAISALASVQFDKAVTIILGAYVTAGAGRLVLRKKAS